MIDKRVSVLRLLNIQDRLRFNLVKLSALLVKALAKFRGKRNVINVISQFSFLVSLAIVWHKQMSRAQRPSTQHTDPEAENASPSYHQRLSMQQS